MTRNSQLSKQKEILLSMLFPEQKNVKCSPRSKIVFDALPTFISIDGSENTEEYEEKSICGIKVRYQIGGYDKRPNNEKGSYLVMYQLIGTK